MLIGHQILESHVKPLLSNCARGSVYFLVDKAVMEHHRDYLATILALEDDSHCLSLESGEANKGLDSLQMIWTWLINNHATRKATLVIIGGGVLTDMGGFAAATYMRGIRSIHIPTTLLSMVDASVGGKTGIDFLGIKNIIGAFHAPIEVFIDVAFLCSLPLDELFSGYAEIIKTALLSGPELWQHVLCIGDPQGLSQEEWCELISDCVAYKERIVDADPQESGVRRVLNLGHTVGHAIEAYSHRVAKHRPLLHGEAVIIGLLVEGYLAVIHRGAERKTLRQLHSLCRTLYSPYHYTCKSYDELWSLMLHDKKNTTGGTVDCIVLIKPGETENLTLSSIEEMKEALDFYRETFGS